MKYYPYTRIFPISHSHVGLFIAFSTQQGLKGSTIQTQVAGLSYINKMMDLAISLITLLLKNSYYLLQKQPFHRTKGCLLPSQSLDSYWIF